MRRELDWRWVGFGGAVVVLVAVSAVSYQSVLQYREDVSWNDHTHQVLEGLERVKAAVLAGNASRTSYRLMRSPADLADIHSAIAEAGQEVDAVAALTRDNPVQQERIAALRPVMAERLAALTDGLDAPQIEDLPPAARDAQRAKLAHAAALGKEIRTAIDVMCAEEERLLAERQARSDGSATSGRRAILAGSATGLALVAGLFLSLLVENRRRQRVQAELERQNGLVQSVLSATPDLIHAKDPEGRYLLVNDAMATYWRRRPSELLGLDAHALLTPPDFEAIAKREAEVRATKLSRTEEQVIHRGDQDHVFLVTTAPLQQGGEVSGIVNIARDITERKRLAAEVSAQNQARGEIIQKLERQSRDMHLLSEMANYLQATLAMPEAYRLASHYAGELLGGTGGVIAITAASRNLVDPVAYWGALAGSQPFAPSECWALRSGRLHHSRLASAATRCPHLGTGIPEAWCVPLLAQGETLGLVQVAVEGESDERQRTLVAFSEQLSLAVANLQLREKLRAQAVRDPLTGLYNRRYLDETLVRELARAQRRGQPVSVVMVDLDHFKRLNDTHGHAAGDEALKRTGRLLLDSVRGEDAACRYGGEELVLILPDCPVVKAAERAEAVRHQIAALELSVDHNAVGPVHASMGVACFPEHGSTAEDLIRAADAALYEAKHTGRNRVVVARAGTAPSGERAATAEGSPEAAPRLG